jgi:diaminohydroxyphosphoribosylaminopyrimidine deaminase/5-amino-6-(5-phosphoribosylamino)uracil reductase
MVGCVIVDKDHLNLYAGGWHSQKSAPLMPKSKRSSGSPLIKGKREAVQGCHIYVTLEPCAHEGRTGSCAKALSAAEASDCHLMLIMWILIRQWPGRVLKSLKDAGVMSLSLAEIHEWPGLPGKVLDAGTKQELIDEAEDLSEIFLWSMRNQGPGVLPFVTVKVASSLDGRVALNDGTSKWITSELAREKGHRLRLEHDAIIVGRRTIETDNPSMNVRLEDITNHTNSVVVVDPKAKLVDRLIEFEVAKVRPTSRVFVCVQTGNFKCEGRCYRKSERPRL